MKGAKLPAILAMLLLVSAVSAHAGNPRDKCQSAKLKATGKQVAAKLKCYAKAAKKAEGVDAECLAKAESVAADQVGKAESDGDCITTGDTPFLENAADACVQTVKNVVPPVVRRVFISSAVYDGNLGGIAGGDAKCQTLADAAGLGGTWIAWISTAAVPAKSRLADARFDDALSIIADGLADLTDQSINANILYDESANLVFPAVIRTGTNGIGFLGDSNCGDFTTASSGSFGIAGKNDFPPSGDDWTTNAQITCDQLAHLYCFEQ